MTGHASLPAAERKIQQDDDARQAAQMTAAFERMFGRPPDAIAAAPGRIEFAGNHTDYNGGRVLGAAIDREICVAVAARSDERRRFTTDLAPERRVEIPAGLLRKQEGPAAWTNYPLGVLNAFAETGIGLSHGFDFLACSTLPEGSGLSSSAALELASAFAFLQLAGHTLPLERIVALCRRAENEFVGVPCGILDQAVSAFGRKNHLVSIDCRGPNFATVPLPGGVNFWVFNTHTRHALIDGLYAERHRECMEAARALGVPSLADATAELLGDSPGRLSETLTRRALHIIGENARVRQISAMLQTGNLASVGRLLNESHASSRVNFENSTPELDFLAASLAGSPEVYGARLTGGGFGGAVLALADAEFDAAAADAVADCYAEHFAARPDVLQLRTSNGARVLHGRHYGVFQSA